MLEYFLIVGETITIGVRILLVGPYLIFVVVWQAVAVSVLRIVRRIKRIGKTYKHLKAVVGATAISVSVLRIGKERTLLFASETVSVDVQFAIVRRIQRKRAQVDLVAVRDTATIGVGVVGIRVVEEFVAVVETVVVHIRIERIEAGAVLFVVGKTVAVGVRILWICSDLVLVGIGESVAISIWRSVILSIERIQTKADLITIVDAAIVGIRIVLISAEYQYLVSVRKAVTVKVEVLYVKRLVTVVSLGKMFLIVKKTITIVVELCLRSLAEVLIHDALVTALGCIGGVAPRPGNRAVALVVIG